MAESHPTRILVVDDHDLSRRYTVAALRQSGVAVKAAACPERAFRLALDWRPQAIFVDLRLPGTHGFAWMDRLHGAWSPGHPRPRLIVLSASRDPMPRSTPAGTPIAAALDKPATPAALRRALRPPAPPGVRDRRETAGPPPPDPALIRLFRLELGVRLRALDRLLAARDLPGAVPVLHRLIASARICRATRLEAELAALRNLCRDNDGPDGVLPVVTLAHRYHALRQAAAAVGERPVARSG